MDKLEQLYAYFSTAGDDTRIFGFGATSAPSKRRLTTLDGLPEGSRVVHPTHGAGVVVCIDMNDMRGKQFAVQYDNGDVHHYNLDSSIKLKVIHGAHTPLTPVMSVSAEQRSQAAINASPLQPDSELHSGLTRTAGRSDADDGKKAEAGFANIIAYSSIRASPVRD